MKSFKQFKTQINELFDKPARWKMTSNRPTYVEYESNINGRRLRVTFNGSFDEKWEVFFDVDTEIGITGGGDEVKIFSTVLDIMKDFIQRNSPEELYFTASKEVHDKNTGKISFTDSRSRLYSRLIRRFAKDHGYSLAHEDDVGWQISYTLVKI